MKKQQVIDVNGVFAYPDDAYNLMRNIIYASDALVDHPDQTQKESANRVIQSLRGTGLLSDKAEAIIQYEEAVTRLYKHTVDED